jgi:hypothetical protein
MDRELQVKALWEKVSMEKLRLPKAEVPKWTRAVDLGGRVAPDLELRVWNTPGESGGWNIPNSRSMESRSRSRPLVAKEDEDR